MPLNKETDRTLSHAPLKMYHKHIYKMFNFVFFSLCTKLLVSVGEKSVYLLLLHSIFIYVYSYIHTIRTTCIYLIISFKYYIIIYISAVVSFESIYAINTP